jgi:hypothetical protein
MMRQSLWIRFSISVVFLYFAIELFPDSPYFRFADRFWAFVSLNYLLFLICQMIVMQITLSSIYRRMMWMIELKMWQGGWELLIFLGILAMMGYVFPYHTAFWFLILGGKIFWDWNKKWKQRVNFERDFLEKIDRSL